MNSRKNISAAKTSSWKVQFLFLAGAIIVAFLLFNLIEYGRLAPLETANRMYARRNILYAAVYLAIYASALSAIIVSIFSRSIIARWVALAVVFAFLSLEICCRKLLGTNIGFAEVDTGLSEMSFAGEFIGSYTSSLTKAILAAGLVTAGLFVAAHFLRVRYSAWWLALVPLSGGLILAILWKTVAMTDVFPSPLRVPALVAYVSVNALDAGERDPVEMIPTDGPKPQNIIFIMDESIRGDRLSINGWTKPTTPYLESIAGEYLNFGIACAASNISSTSNFVVRSGLKADELPDYTQRGLKCPSIFQYAKAAGYRTVYLDGQYAPGVMGNFMSSYDFDHIDVAYWAVADEPDPHKKYVRDRLLLAKVHGLMADGTPTFFWLNKYGAHFHYDTTYPPGEAVFAPVMPDGRPIDACEIEEIENSFANSVRWNVDEFLKSLLEDVDLAQIVVLYTSDHGQSFKEGNGLSTHADRSDPPSTQATVPVLAWGDMFHAHFPGGAAAVRDQTDHFQLFPSMLVLMGYDETAVVERYGQPLWGEPPTSRKFLSGDAFGRGTARLNSFVEPAASLGPTPAPN